MKEFIRKITSRKFLESLGGFLLGAFVTFGMSENTAAQITGMIVALGSIVAYIVGEAKIDAAAAAGAEPKPP